MNLGSICTCFVTLSLFALRSSKSLFRDPRAVCFTFSSSTSAPLSEVSKDRVLFITYIHVHVHTAV